MSLALMVTLGEKIRSSIETAMRASPSTFTMKVPVTREYPQLTAEALDKIQSDKVVVSLAELPYGRLTRKEREIKPTFTITVLSKLKGFMAADADPYMLLTEQLYDFFWSADNVRYDLGDGAIAKFVKTDDAPPYSQDYLDAIGLFASTIVAIFILERSDA